MALEIQQIVEKLNEPPFSMGLTLVSFDEKGPKELLQLLNDVITDLEPAQKADIRSEAPEVTGPRISKFLEVLKYPVPNGGERQRFEENLVNGDRRTLYPVLRYVLQRRDTLKKRAYVARYLSKVEVPPEFLHEESMQELMQQLHALQLRFREVHKEVDRMRAAETKPSELRREIRQLEEERGQLTDKIASLKARTEDLEGFRPLLEATSSLRKEQEEESKLAERLLEQRQALAVAEKRYSDAARRLAEARSSAKEDMSGEDVLNLVRREEAENRRLLSEALPKSIEARRSTLSRLHERLSEPARSAEEVDALRRELQATETRVERLTEEVAAAQRAAGDDKLALYRQQSALIAKKRVQEEDAIDTLRDTIESLDRTIERTEAKLSELSGPRFMRREEFRAYREGLIRKTREYKAARSKLAALRQETVVLSRTEALLKSRAGDVDEVLAKLEERRGVTGYLGVQRDLEKVSAMKAAVDETKGRTLAEISKVVTDINHSLQERKTKLAPQVRELRKVRLDFTEMESRYLQVRGRWEQTSAGLDAQRSALERDCDALQQDCIEAEREYHRATATAETLRDRLARAEDEAKFQNGEGTLLRDFASWKDLYANKLGQQEHLARELRRRQKELNESSVERSEQRKIFASLQTILDMKRKLYQQGKAGPAAAAREEAAASANVDHVEIGGANVMTLE